MKVEVLLVTTRVLELVVINMATLPYIEYVVSIFNSTHKSEPKLSLQCSSHTYNSTHCIVLALADKVLRVSHLLEV